VAGPSARRAAGPRRPSTTPRAQHIGASRTSRAPRPAAVQLAAEAERRRCRGSRGRGRATRGGRSAGRGAAGEAEGGPQRHGADDEGDQAGGDPLLAEDDEAVAADEHEDAGDVEARHSRRFGAGRRAGAGQVEAAAGEQEAGRADRERGDGLEGDADRQVGGAPHEVHGEQGARRGAAARARVARAALERRRPVMSPAGTVMQRGREEGVDGGAGQGEGWPGRQNRCSRNVTGTVPDRRTGWCWSRRLCWSRGGYR
jgi:hypothetical protein